MTRLSRRRFLCLSAAALALPAEAAPFRWRGHALGADISLTLRAPEPLAQRALEQTKYRLGEIETLFSLYDPTSLVSVLNREGQLQDPPALFRALIQQCTDMHHATHGVFDPTVQSLWRARAQGLPDPAPNVVDWGQVDKGPTLRLGSDQEVTFNGIAQGFATDLVRADFQALGLTNALVNIGEFAALGGPFKLGLADPEHGLFATRPISDAAIATSSAGAMTIGGQSHIALPGRAPHWSSVTVTAKSAAIADAASTAFTLMTRREIRQSLRTLPEISEVALLAKSGVMSVI